MQTPHYSQHIRHWLLDQQTVFLNHGSFGACPIAVLDAQSEYRKQLETQPLRFMMREFEPMFNRAKSVLAGFVGAEAEDMVYVRNATEGVNTVLNSIQWMTGDRILITDQIYPACRNAVVFYADKFRLEVDEVQLPYPLRHPEEALRAVAKGVRADTRLIVVDHISSPTGMVFPVKELAAALEHSDAEILVDGAHAPGAIPLNISDLGVHYYTGNCHKWMCAPKGAAFLWVTPDLQFQMMPLNISLINAGDYEFQGRFYWTGTFDPSAFLSVPDAIQCLQEISGNGYDAVIQSNHALTVEAAQILSDALEIPLPCPEEMMASMVAFPLPDLVAEGKNQSDPLQEVLYHTYRIEVPVMRIASSGQRFIRVSCHLYNSIEQYKFLGEVLRKEVRKL